MAIECIGGLDPEISRHKRDMRWLQALEAGDDGWADGIEADTLTNTPSPVVQLLQEAAVSTCIDGQIAS